MTLDTPLAPGAARKRRSRSATSLTRSSGLGLGIALTWFSALVLIPLALVVVQSTEGGWATFRDTLTNPQTAAALRLTVTQALIVTLVNVVVGTLIAWVLVRDSFPGKRILEVIIDIPFALPTIVAGLVLLSLYGPQSPLGINVANTERSVFLALLFVTLPFVVRTVEPVLLELDPEVEQAAASLGASRFTTFRRILLPALAPAITAGAALVVRARHQRVRIARPALGQPAQQDRGRLGAHPDLHRERQRRGRRHGRRAAAPRRPRRDHRAADPLEGGGAS